MSVLRMIDVAPGGSDGDVSRFVERCVPVAALYAQGLALHRIEVPLGSTLSEFCLMIGGQ